MKRRMKMEKEHCHMYHSTCFFITAEKVSEERCVHKYNIVYGSGYPDKSEIVARVHIEAEPAGDSSIPTKVELLGPNPNERDFIMGWTLPIGVQPSLCLAIQAYTSQLHRQQKAV